MNENKKASPLKAMLYFATGIYILIGAVFGSYKLILARYKCFEEGGFGGIFWCPDLVSETFVSHFKYVVAWPFYI